MVVVGVCDEVVVSGGNCYVFFVVNCDGCFVLEYDVCILFFVW